MGKQRELQKSANEDIDMCKDVQTEPDAMDIDALVQNLQGKPKRRKRRKKKTAE